MNKTRLDWSSLYGCCRDKRDSLTAFFSLAAAIFVIAISFYLSVYIVGIKYQQTETLDEREVLRNFDEDSDNPTPGTSSTTIPVRNLVVNGDESDEEILSGSPVKPLPADENLIKLDN